jgi:hypothetical protein
VNLKWLRIPSDFGPLIVAGLSVAGYLVVSAGRLGTSDFDDAYMVTRYAHHWLAGHGFSWNIEDGPSYGITSPAYLFLITGVLWASGLPDAVVLSATSYVTGLAALGVVAALGFLVLRRQPMAVRMLSLWAVPFIVLTRTFAYHSLTGMETTLSLLTNAILAVAVVHALEKHTNTATVLCCVAGLATTMVRPDNGLYAVMLPALMYAADDWRWQRALAHVAFTATLIVLAVASCWMLFGDPLPLPFYAKSHGFYEGYVGGHRWNPFTYQNEFLWVSAPFVIAFCASVQRDRARLAVLPLLVVAVAFAYYFTVVQIMGYHARYYYPALPFVVLAAELAVSNALGSPSSTPNVWRWRFGLVAGVLVFVLSEPIREAMERVWTHATRSVQPVLPKLVVRTPAAAPLPTLGWMASIEAMNALVGALPEDAVFAASEHGIIGTHHPNTTIVDLVGLHDSRIAHHGFSADYVMSRAPDLVWMPHSDYSSSRAMLIDHPVFQSQYEYYPQAFDTGVALKRTSPRYGLVAAAFAAYFSRVYRGERMHDHRALYP